MEILVLGLFALLLPLSFCSEDVETLKRGSENFTHNLFRELKLSHPNANIIYSPFNIQTCLTMARLGAGGETAQEMDKVLGLTGQQTLETVADNYFSILSKYQDGSILHLANKVYVMKGYDLNDEYNELLSTKFLSSVESIDFGNSIEAAAIVNEWVADHTNKKIERVATLKTFKNDVRLFLLSVIYFNGQWEKPFLHSQTSDLRFHMNETHEVFVPTMRKTDDLHYARFPDLKASAIRLFYKNSDLSMLIFLPKSVTGLDELEEKLMNIELKALTQQLRVAKVYLRLPKFRADLSVNLKPTLKKLGLNHTFSDADFSKMIKSSSQLQVSSIIHMATIEVDETGTEAAAATGITASAVSMPRSFIANHPFHYMIIDTEHNILFQGNVIKF